MKALCCRFDVRFDDLLPLFSLPASENQDAFQRARVECLKSHVASNFLSFSHVFLKSVTMAELCFDLDL
ncbi:MAG: hypothetical protein JWM11_795 [Planctomycetaceae bacterium]|nr:hypothetical protein [Planctomycetaceae bacterium]